MANSPLLTMPILNGLPQYDYGDQINPSNIFGNLSIGVNTHYQDVPADLCFAGDWCYYGATLGFPPCGGIMTGMEMFSYDFYSIWDPSILSTTRISKDLYLGGSSNKRNSLVIAAANIKARYWDALPEIPPSYGEARPNFNKWREAKNNLFKTLTTWEIIVSKYDRFRLLCLIVLYSRFRTENIKKYLWFKQVEYPTYTGSRSYYSYGIAETPEMVPTLWGATVLQSLLDCVAIINLDIFYYIMWKNNVIKSIADIRSVIDFYLTSYYSVEFNSLDPNKGQGQLLMYSNEGSPRDKFGEVLYTEYVLKKNSVYKILRDINPSYVALDTISGCNSGDSLDYQMYRGEYQNFFIILYNALQPKDKWYLDYEAMWNAFQTGFIPPGGNY